MIRPALTFAVHEDGSIERTSPWFPHITIAVEMLAHPHPCLERVDDRVTFHCTNGGATYQLSLPDAQGYQAGRLIRAWDSPC